ncbi:MAG: hypothetical protein ABEJ56_01430 [Candidatus Nanohaloarchaea archaeon]
MAGNSVYLDLTEEEAREFDRNGYHVEETRRSKYRVTPETDSDYEGVMSAEVGNELMMQRMRSLPNWRQTKDFLKPVATDGGEVEEQEQEYEEKMRDVRHNSSVDGGESQARMFERGGEFSESSL